jgi:hypothetical protein
VLAGPLWKVLLGPYECMHLSVEGNSFVVSHIDSSCFRSTTVVAIAY